MRLGWNAKSVPATRLGITRRVMPYAKRYVSIPLAVSSAMRRRLTATIGSMPIARSGEASSPVKKADCWYATPFE